MRALILLSSLGLTLGTLSSTAGPELCRNALAARDTLREAPAVTAAVDAFYAKAGSTCAWSSENADAIMRTVDAAQEHGLDPDLFNATRIAASRDASDETAKAALDLQLTAAALKYALVMTSGLANIVSEDGDSDRRGLQRKLVSELAAAIEQDNIAAWTKTLPPQSAGYERLKYALGVTAILIRRAAGNDLLASNRQIGKEVGTRRTSGASPPHRR